MKPIEHLWGELKRRLRQLPFPPVTLEDLAKVRVNLWQDTPQELISTLINIAVKQTITSHAENLIVVSAHEKVSNSNDGFRMCRIPGTKSRLKMEQSQPVARVTNFADETGVDGTRKWLQSDL
ncbi:hypothetical protein ILUMI_26613 [Ignelater luminosus]|uniref:Uncharacterized protein n=1 Tax=Ignelater luminosus TaxID=2038154 RepID=A0A8K0C481_IGNLU|nr:hypothetical protein ILUMI_26613 [Ignelater luminosus]